MGMNLEEAFSQLGINQGSEEDDIRKAYKKLALATHPDKNPGDPEAKIKFQKISEAYNRIINADEYSSGEDGGSEDEGCQCCQCKGHRFHMSEEEMYAMFNFIFRGGPPFSNFSWKGRRNRDEGFGPMGSFMDSDSEEEFYSDRMRSKQRVKTKEELEREARERKRYEEEQARLREQRLKEQEERRRLREQRRKEQEEQKKKAEIRKKVEQELARQKKEAAAAKRREERLKKMQEKVDNRKLLLDACITADLNEVIRLIEREGVKCYERSSEDGKEGASLLHLCVQDANSKEPVELQKARFKIAEYLLECDGSEALDWSWVDEYGLTILHKAAMQGDLPLLAAVLDHRKGNHMRYMQLDINGLCLSDQGWTPLHYAAKAGHRDVVIALLEHGAKVKIVTEPQDSRVKPQTAAQLVSGQLALTANEGMNGGHHVDTCHRRQLRRCLKLLQEAAAEADRRKARRQQEADQRRKAESEKAREAKEKDKIEKELLQKKQKQLRDKLARQQQDELAKISAEAAMASSTVAKSSTKKKKKKDRRVKNRTDADDKSSTGSAPSQTATSEKAGLGAHDRSMNGTKRLEEETGDEWKEAENMTEEDAFDGDLKRSGGSFRPRVPCHFYAQGKCTRGDACNFLHEIPKEGVVVEGAPSSSGSTNGTGAASGGRFVPRIPCHFYAQGKCNRGDKCTFLHLSASALAAEEKEAMQAASIVSADQKKVEVALVAPTAAAPAAPIPPPPVENPWHVTPKPVIPLVSTSEFPALGDACGKTSDSADTKSHQETAAPQSNQSLSPMEKLNLSISCEQLVEMGFSLDQVRKASAQAGGDPDRTLELLLNGTVGNGQSAGASEPSQKMPEPPVSQIIEKALQWDAPPSQSIHQQQQLQPVLENQGGTNFSMPSLPLASSSPGPNVMGSHPPSNSTWQQPQPQPKPQPAVLGLHQQPSQQISNSMVFQQPPGQTGGMGGWNASNRTPQHPQAVLSNSATTSYHQPQPLPTVYNFSPPSSLPQQVQVQQPLSMTPSQAPLSTQPHIQPYLSPMYPHQQPLQHQQQQQQHLNTAQAPTAQFINWTQQQQPAQNCSTQAPWTGLNLDASTTSQSNLIGINNWTASSQQKQGDDLKLDQFEQFGTSPFSSSIASQKAPEPSYLLNAGDSLLDSGLFLQSKPEPISDGHEHIENPFASSQNNDDGKSPFLSGDLTNILQSSCENLKNESVFSDTLSNWGLSNLGSTVEQDSSKASGAEEFSNLSSFLATVSENSKNDWNSSFH